MIDFNQAKRSEEMFYYNNLDAIRMHGVPMDNLVADFLELLKTYITSRRPITNCHYYRKTITFLINDRNISPRTVVMLLEALEMKNMEIIDKPQLEEVVIEGNISLYDIEATVMIGQSEKCEYIETGSKIVPVYELRCKEDE